jgi:hypothetical protein
MRQDLHDLRAAGVRRARFSARFAFRDHRGCIALEDVVSPTGTTDHVWIRPDDWRGRMPQPGDEVVFTASIRPYYKGAGEQDFGLFCLEVLR